MRYIAAILVTCGLRDYGVAGQIGLEPTPEQYVAKMVEVFREVRRVLRDDATLWLNLGDSYMGGGRGGGAEDCKQRTNVGSLDAAPNQRCPGYKAKDLVGVPWMMAFALRADGWWLRSDIIWSKPNPMPESVTDRPTKAHEYLFLLSKSERYYYDAEAIREPWTCDRDDMRHKGVRTGLGYLGGAFDNSAPDASFGDGQRVNGDSPAGRNIRTVWTIPTFAFPDAHFATFPPKLVEPCIKAGTSERGCCAACGAPLERVLDVKYVKSPVHGEGSQIAKNGSPHGMEGMPRLARDARTTGWQPTCSCSAESVPCTVLDPFGGAGTTGLVARRLGREYILIELNPAYATIAERRIAEYAPLFAESAP